MRVLFAGSPSLAVPCLARIARERDVCAVLTAADQPAGRGRTFTPTPVKETAVSLGIRVLQPERLDERAMEDVKSCSPDILVVAAYGRIFKKEFLDLFPLGGINVHPSLLPRYRGPSPIAAAIIAGDAITGVTIQRIALSFDTGDILAQARFPLGGDESAGSLGESLAAIGADLLSSVLGDMAEDRAPMAVTQCEEEATYCPIVRKEDGRVDWNEPAILIERKVRAYDPWPRAATTLAGSSLLLLKTHLYTGTLPIQMRREPAEPTPGRVLGVDKAHGMLVQTGDGVLAVEELQLQYKKPMDWRACLNGRPDLIGALLGERG
jgi:methionyl-tRNA formyltransferase